MNRSRLSEQKAERNLFLCATAVILFLPLLFLERLNRPLGGAAQLGLLSADVLTLFLAYRMSDRRAAEAVWYLTFLIPLEIAALLFFRQPWHYVCQAAHSPVRAVLVWLVLSAAALPLLFRLRRTIRFPLHAFALIVLLFAFSFLWTEAVNISLDPHPGDPVAAERISQRRTATGRGTLYEVKLAFPLPDRRIETHWFTVRKDMYLLEEYTLLRRPGALGITWYEPIP